jgi:hypothetical protein
MPVCIIGFAISLIRTVVSFKAGCYLLVIPIGDDAALVVVIWA